MKSRGRAGGRRDDENSLRLNALQVGLWDYDVGSDKLVCDERWYQITGLPLHSVQSLDDLRPSIHPDDVDLATGVDLTELDALIARDLRYHIDFRIIRPDGETRALRSVACVLIDPTTGHHRALGCITDYSDFAVPLAVVRPAEPGEPDHPEALAPGAVLSERELECLRWVSLGKTAWETAKIMGRSQRTVEFHLTNATRKLTASNKIHAAVIAVRKGLI